MPVFVRVDVNNRLLQRILRSPAGPVARNMLVRGRRVRDAARNNVNSRTGTLARSIEVSVAPRGEAPGARVGTSLHYARYVHDGTGIYGPRGQLIKPGPGRKALTIGTGFAAYSRGQRGTKFLERALRAAG